MGFDLDVTISVFVVFMQGIVSFLSPCVLPIIPLYMGYLSGGNTYKDENGDIKYDQKSIIINTFFFVLGISVSFLLLGIGFSALGKFLVNNQELFTKIGGIIILLFGIIKIKNKYVKILSSLGVIACYFAFLLV